MNTDRQIVLAYDRHENGVETILSFRSSPIPQAMEGVLERRQRAEDAVPFVADAGASVAELLDYKGPPDPIASLEIGAFADLCVRSWLPGRSTVGES